MMDVGRHPNITLWTNSEVVKVDGEAGDFKVDVLRQARYVDFEKCNGCGDCSPACPVGLCSEFDVGLVDRSAIYRPFPQAVPNKFVIDKRGVSPCKFTCPADVNAQGYVALASQGKFEEALALEREENPFPSVCGRVCTHPCEGECKRGDFDVPVAIRSIKRFLADCEEEPPKPELPKAKKQKVAIVGSGPSGLACAHRLGKLGYASTVFEALPVAGGMLAAGIPEFRLPREGLRRDIDYIKSWRVTIKTDHKVDDLEKLLKEGYSAVYVATGAWRERKLNVEGEDLEGVYYGVDFLSKVNLGEKVEVGERVAVIGGGNSAIDAARTAVRSGGKEVTIVYRRSRVEMPALEEEIEEAEHEGVRIDYLAAPTRFMGEKGKLTQMECIRMELGPPDESGRRRPLPIEGSEFTMDVDTVILTIGQTPDTSYLPADSSIALEKWDNFAVDPDTLQTSVPGIFAGGDAVTGPATVIEAIAAGKEAAISIDRYIRGVDLKEGRKVERAPVEEVEIPPHLQKAERQEMAFAPVKERTSSFAEVALGLTEEQVIAEAARCFNCGGCCECGECEKVCEPEAIVHDMEDEIIEEDIGAIIVATGFDFYDPQEASEYGFKRFRNVITSLQLERLLSASGPTRGILTTLTDDEPPERVAFIQCVGSRSVKRGILYCSRICCMNAVKDALLIEELFPESEQLIFNIDMRAFGKGFEAFFERSHEISKLRYVKGKPSKVTEDGETGELILHYEDSETAKIERKKVDMVVLSSALVPSKGTAGLAEVLGIEVDGDGFLKSRDASAYPLESTREGVYVAGGAIGPKDITDAVAEASGASALAAGHMLDNRVEPVHEEIEPIDVSGEPRIGVFVCHCGINIAGVLDVAKLTEYARILPNVAFAEHALFACAESTQRQIQDRIAEHALNRVVVAACTPRTHEPVFRETCARIGLNPYLVEMVNIRDQCSWVHHDQPVEATEKARDLIRMATARSRLLSPLAAREFGVGHEVLVVGGGIAGIQAAIDLSKRGFEVHLAEQHDRLGGRVLDLASIYPSGHSGKWLIDEKVRELEERGVDVRTGVTLTEVSGFVGNFEAVLSPPDGRDGSAETLDVGAIVIASGADVYTPDGEFAFGEVPNVIGNTEFESVLGADSPKFHGKPVQDVVYVQCVGSRGPKGNPECSRYCCQAAIRQAIQLREKGINVVILHRDVRVYSRGGEEMYRKAREMGVTFFRYDPDDPPTVGSVGDRARVVLKYKPHGIDIALPADVVVLSLGMVARAETAGLVDLLKVPVGSDGFLLERHPKFGPVETNTEGIFLCGCAQAPKDIGDSIAQSSAVASKVGALLARDTIAVEPVTAVVADRLCRSCGQCVEVCEFHAIEIEELPDGRRAAVVNEALCKGCGTCAVVCPNGAISIRHFTSEMIESMIEAYLAPSEKYGSEAWPEEELAEQE